MPNLKKLIEHDSSTTLVLKPTRNWGKDYIAESYTVLQTLSIQESKHGLKKSKVLILKRILYYSQYLLARRFSHNTTTTPKKLSNA